MTDEMLAEAKRQQGKIGLKGKFHSFEFSNLQGVF
jgi:hypothetical protein